MRAWRRSSRVRARNTAYVYALDPEPVPNPFAPLSWPPPPVDGPPIGAPVGAPPVAAVAAPPAAPVEALLLDRPLETEVHIHEPAPTVPTEPAPPAPEASVPVASAPG